MPRALADAVVLPHTQAAILQGAATKLEAANWTQVRSGSLLFTSAVDLDASPGALYGIFKFPGYVAGAFPMAEQDVRGAVWPAMLGG